MHPKDLMTLAQEGKGSISYGRRFTASALNSMFQSEVSDAPGSPPTKISAQEEFLHARTVGNQRTAYLPVGAHSVFPFQLIRILSRSNSNHEPRPHALFDLSMSFLLSELYKYLGAMPMVYSLPSSRDNFHNINLILTKNQLYGGVILVQIGG